MWRMLPVISVVLAAAPAAAQAPPNPEHVNRLTELISKAPGPYRKIAEGVWETSYKGRNAALVRVRIATAGEGVFFMVSLSPRETVVLTRELLLKLAEFNASYDYVKLALEQTSLDLRLDAHASLLDLPTFLYLENQAALAADAAYGLLKE